MAPRKYHLGVGVIVYIAFSVLFYYWFLGNPIYLPAKIFGIAGNYVIPINRTLSSADILYLAVSFLLVLTGAEVADYDKAIMWMQHRDWFTHSSILPTIFAAIVMIFTMFNVGDPLQSLFYNPGVSGILSLIMVPFVLGAASHLLLDWFPPIDVKELTSVKGSLEAGHQAADFFISGMTGKELIRRLQGMALVHFWWEVAVPKEQKKSRSKVQKYEMRKTLDSEKSRLYYTVNALILLLVAALLMLQYILIEFSTASQQLMMLLLL